jgi:membrane-anchored mycosin MYCP
VARITATADGPAGPGTGHGLVNPVQAVTAVLPATAAGSTTAPAHSSVTIDRTTHPAARPSAIALPLAAGAAGLGALFVAAAAIIPAGRRRHWRPGPSPPRAQPGAEGQQR